MTEHAFCAGILAPAAGNAVVAPSRCHACTATRRTRATAASAPTRSDSTFEFRGSRVSSFLGSKVESAGAARSALRLCRKICAAAAAAQASSDVNGVSEERVMVFPEADEYQFRAIGLVSGRFVPNPERPRTGTLVADDGTEMDARILPRFGPFLEKLDLDKPQTWVVYPKTRVEGGTGTELRLDIKGVREPALKEAAAKEAREYANPPGCATIEGYFSVRGVVVLSVVKEEGPGLVVVKIETEEPGRVRPFAIRLAGRLPRNAYGKFWDLEVRREGEALVVRHAAFVGPAPAAPAQRPTPEPQPEQ